MRRENRGSRDRRKEEQELEGKKEEKKRKIARIRSWKWRKGT